MKKYILTILAALCLCSCNVDYDYLSILTIKNNSSHIISIKNDNYMYSLECSINPGESYSVKGGGEMPWGIPIFIGENCPVVFDGEIEIRHKKNSTPEHSICDEGSYSIKVSGRHDTKTEYTYTFTDEDYDRAVAASANAD